MAVRVGTQPLRRFAEVEGRHRQARAQRQRQRVRVGLRPDRRHQHQIGRDLGHEIEDFVILPMTAGLRDLEGCPGDRSRVGSSVEYRPVSVTPARSRPPVRVGSEKPTIEKRKAGLACARPTPKPAAAIRLRAG